MARKTSSAPPAGFDPNFPLDPSDLDDLNGHSAVAVADPAEVIPSVAVADWPAVPWREHDLRFLRYANGQATGEDVAYIMSLGLERRAIDRECSRVVTVAGLLPTIGTQAEMECLQAREASERERIDRARQQEVQRFEQTRREHEATLRALDRELSAVSDASTKMAQARETVGRLLPEVAQQARAQARKTFLESDAKRELETARERLLFLKRAAAMRMIVVVETKPDGSTVTEPARILHPHWLFEQGHEGYLCDRPRDVQPRGQLTASQVLSQFLDGVGWDAKRAELDSRIPAAKAEVDRLAAEYTAAERAVHAQVSSFTYLID